MDQAQLVGVVLCGGSGTRLWPYSRESLPKQFLSLGQEASLLQDTVQRLLPLQGKLPVNPTPILVTNAEHRFMVAGQLESMGLKDCPIVLEPEGKNTAPALTLAALQASAQGQDPVLLVMPADHIIADAAAFEQAVTQAYHAALQPAMVTFGIVPTAPETGFGYIQQGEPHAHGAHTVLQFKEKPAREVAEAYVSSGQYLWNSGLFVVRASVWLQCMQAFKPAMYADCKQAMDQAQVDPDFIRPLPAAFARCESDSIDYAVMERLAAHPELGVTPLVVPMNAQWSDVGAWDAVWDTLAKDAQGNALVGDALAEQCTNSLLFSTSRLVSAVGVDGVVVVETPDAVLVLNKDQAQGVKNIVNTLKKQGRNLTSAHRKMYRPWGWYDSIDQGPRFQVKRIVVNPGCSLSLQMHHHRAEHWIVVSGTAEVTNGDKTFMLGENESTFIPLGHVHRLRNPGKIPLEIVEVQSGAYLGEDDIVRFEDTYGRVGR